MNRITVLHVRCSNYAGGPETTLLGWMRFADRTRFDPRILFFEERRGAHLRSVEIFNDNQVPVAIIPWGERRDLRGAVREVTRMAREAGAAVLHAHDVRSDVVCLLAARATGAPVVVSNHAWHAVGFKRWLFEALRGWWLRYADMVVNVSADTDRETVRRGVHPSRSMTIYSGLDLTPYRDPMPRADAKRRLGLDPADVVVGNVARMWPEKALHTLIEMAHRLRDAHPSLKVVLVGDGPLDAELRRRAAELRVEDRVVFAGFRKDLVDVMSAFDVFALPSSAEGTPMVVYSAMALGLPVVASAVNGVAEILRDGETGILIKPADVGELTTAVERLLADPAFGAALGAAALDSVQRNYSAETAVRRFETLYQDLLAAKSRR